MLKLGNIKYTEKALKESREKKQVSYKGKIRILADFSATMREASIGAIAFKF